MEDEYKRKLIENLNECKVEISIPKRNYKNAYMKIWSDCDLSEFEVAQKFKQIINKTNSIEILKNVTSIRYQGYAGYAPHWQNWFLYQAIFRKQGLEDFHEYFKSSDFSKILANYGLFIKEIMNEQYSLIGSQAISSSKEIKNYFDPGVYLMIEVSQCNLVE
ncbi:hypothetical protein AB1S50_18875 [Microbulbifer sp. 2201CG32-9]